jgi:hypothetical protein
MSEITLIEDLRDACRRAAGRAAERDIGLAQDWIIYIANHVLVAGSVAFAVRVIADFTLPPRRPPVDIRANSAPPPDGLQELNASIKALEDAFRRTGQSAFSNFDKAAARRDIVATLRQVRIEGDPLDPEKIEDLADELSERFAQRMAAEAAGPAA